VAKLELTRSPDDRRLYVLPGVGELRTGGLLSGGRVEATAGGRTYTFALRGRVRRVAIATDAFGEEVGRQDGSLSIVWRGDRWDLKAYDAGFYYTLTRSGEDREVANLAPALWSRRPVPIVLDETARVDPGLVLFAMFLMRRIAEEINRAPGGDGGRPGF
jgi:hypothetical protein